MPPLEATDHALSTAIAERIEDLYGMPLADLKALADSHPNGSMLAALTRGHTKLQLAERNITFQLQRLHELTAPERTVGRFDAGHIFDCARRITESIATRDAHATTLAEVLGSLCRTPAQEPDPPATPAVPPPAAVSTAPTR